MKVNEFIDGIRIEVGPYWFFPGEPSECSWATPNNGPAQYIDCPKEYRIIELLFGGL